jgi:hypothetical protein
MNLQSHVYTRIRLSTNNFNSGLAKTSACARQTSGAYKPPSRFQVSTRDPHRPDSTAATINVCLRIWAARLCGWMSNSSRAVSRMPDG